MARRDRGEEEPTRAAGAWQLKVLLRSFNKQFYISNTSAVTSLVSDTPLLFRGYS